jgi:YesN/AraC family two-component response regulator
MAQEAIHIVNEIKPELVLLDIKLKNSSGFEVAVHIKKEYPNIKIIVLTAYSEFDFAHKALNLGIGEYLLKPVRPSILLERIEKALSGKTRIIAGNTLIWPLLESNMVDEIKSTLNIYPNIIAIGGFNHSIEKDVKIKIKDILEKYIGPQGIVESKEDVFITYSMIDSEPTRQL